MLTSVVIALVVAFALQPPSPGGREHESPPPRQQTAPDQPKAEDVRGTQQSPAVVSLLPIPKTPEQAAQDQADRDEKTFSNRWMLGLTGALVVATIGLIGVGFLQWGTYRATLATNQEIERAYVILSHQTPASGALGFNAAAHEVHYAVEVQNPGRTPATILGGIVSVECSSSGTPPSINNIPSGPHQRIPPSFVMPNDRLIFDSMASHLTPEQIVSATDISSLEGPVPIDLWLTGYVDYRDQFKREHRSGYGRHYNRHTGQLLFDQTTATLNYDQPLTSAHTRHYENHG